MDVITVGCVLFLKMATQTHVEDVHTKVIQSEALYVSLTVTVRHNDSAPMYDKRMFRHDGVSH